MDVHYSSARTGDVAQDEWRTPPEIVRLAQAALQGITLDPCADPDRSVEALRHFTAEDDGLKRAADWRGERVYMNPPYSAAKEWVRRFVLSEIEAGIALLPARPGSQWWQMLGQYRLPMCLIHGRLTFVGAPNCAPFPSVLFYRGGNVGRFAATFEGAGHIWIRV